MTKTLRELAAVCGAEILRGNPEAAINAAANIDEARSGELTFIASARYLDKLPTTHASAAIVPKGTEPGAGTAALLAAEDPEIAFIQCLNVLYPEKLNLGTVSAKAEIHPSATVGAGTFVDAFVRIGERAKIGKNCRLHAGCYIGDDAVLGDGCTIHPNVTLYYGVRLGDNVIIHAGTVIGSDGYGYKFRNGKHVKFPQVGTVEIGSNVEIGANTCVDRAALGATRIGEGTKMDNQVHIAHNVQVGKHVLMCGQVGVGGSTTIGDYVTLISQCGVADHVTVGEQAMVFAQAGVTKDVAPKDQVMGYPAINRREALHHMAALRKLADEQKALDELVKLLPRLKTLIK